MNSVDRYVLAIFIFFVLSEGFGLEIDTEDFSDTEQENKSIRKFLSDI